MKTLTIFFLIILCTGLYAKPLYIVAGGFASCHLSKSSNGTKWGSAIRSGFHKSFKANIVNKKDTAYIFSCFNTDGISSLKKFDKAKVTITNSAFPDYERSIEVREYLLYIDSFFDAYKTKYDLDSIILLGHSHGSYLLMKKAPLMNTEYKINSLTTLDAVSKEKCGLWDYVGSLLTFKLKKNCRVFPQDIEDVEKDVILARVGQWQNIYQTDFKWLHSGPANHPGVEDILMVDTSHTSLNQDERMWDLFMNFN